MLLSQMIELILPFLVSSYPYSSLQMVTSDFNKSFKLGEGAFGSVFQGQLEQNTDVGRKKHGSRASVR